MTTHHQFPSAFARKLTYVSAPPIDPDTYREAMDLGRKAIADLNVGNAEEIANTFREQGLKAECGSLHRCAVAQAIQNAVPAPEGSAWAVNGHQAYLTYPAMPDEWTVVKDDQLDGWFELIRGHIVDLSQGVQDFIYRFDQKMFPDLLTEEA